MNRCYDNVAVVVLALTLPNCLLSTRLRHRYREKVDVHWHISTDAVFVGKKWPSINRHKKTIDRFKKLKQTDTCWRQGNQDFLFNHTFNLCLHFWHSKLFYNKLPKHLFKNYQNELNERQNRLRKRSLKFIFAMYASITYWTFNSYIPI